MSVVLDSTALIALFRSEGGADIVATQARGALLLTVNLTEVVQRMRQFRIPPDEVLQELALLEVHIVPFTLQHAVVAGELFETTRVKGLALGDRACLALALERGLPVLTTDSDWLKVQTGADVRLIRERRDQP